ncbi:alpha-amylase family glycosyl hydrolase [Metabacillus litoralis]|uniref:alpha-amylase family glycosyl hydrolase n=1 Tax=Metabacillus litoralis TaxID=152268 RepID=UPI002041185A|nr:alpha-amylase family glycosyl hydrolase [Metabacillus litoralis]
MSIADRNKVINEEEFKENKAQYPEWGKDAVIYEVNVRQYTSEGTFKAFEEHLPRLKNLGVDILWFMPIHPISKEKRAGTLGSYYAVQNYTAVNPEFGTMDDFKRLVEKAHEMGFKILLDLVANHTGWDSEWMKNETWYKTNNHGEILSPTAQGTTWHDVAQLNYDHPDMCAAMLSAMKFWVEEADIDGYRADYAGGVPVEFWEKARKELDKIKQVYMLAEDNRFYELLDEAFHSNYGWELNHIMRDIAKGEKSASDIKDYIDRMGRLYPQGTYPMHWTTNHDDNSWEGTTSELFGKAEKAMAVLTFTLPGIPLIYSGQEAGLDKRLEFFEKDEISWNDLTMQAFYKELICLKKENSALWNGHDGGDTHFLESLDERIFMFERVKEKNRVVVMVNLSQNHVSTTLKNNSLAGSYKLYFDHSPFRLTKEHTFDFEPWGFYVLIQK